ncbi:NAD-glutamate dehydrogenase [Pseudidiomarina salinarum]|uniref:NAD-glutamate dehydrogenase n=1 Tax=Pseudidiomarina salinarum TaxID=435908 RepID=A0A094J1G2_9GAMM|nr:NAD-glutamate dehydrogenase [Pseudidiomarina salinarum]KFZ31849.1 NAD-glutamate dehydrogenase [Pseudidiomarina salinarum]RUO70379.1 NAD-glutamate dehydrogenase [Pseudidiomarina salinarum]
MNSYGQGQLPVILQKVADLIQKRATDRPDLIQDFALRLFRNISSDDLAERNDSDLYGAVMGLWHSFNQYKPGEKALIKVYNPEVARHGWESAHTIIEIIQSDTPFMVDSVRMALSRLGISAHLLLHLPISHRRDDEQGITELLKPGVRDGNEVDTVFLIEVDRQTSQEARTKLKTELASVMDEVNLSVSDWRPMREKLKEVAESLSEIKYPGPAKKLKEAQRFLSWLAKDNFTLMGYRRYDLVAVEGDHVIRQQPDSSLGLMRKSATNKERPVSSLPEVARDLTFNDSLLLVTKTNSKSRVHRPAYGDYIGVKRFDKKGKVIGEDRFIGLYSSSFYNNSARDVPLVGEKIKRVMDASGFAPNSHAAKALLNILETYPRDEVVQADEDDLLEIGLGVLQMQERDMTRLFVRRDIFGRFASCMVYVPKERYNTLLRQRTQQILARSLDSPSDVDFTTYFSESSLARTHYTVRLGDHVQDIDVKELEQNLVEAARTWEDNFERILRSTFGEARANALNKKYANAFPRAYKEEVLPSVAIADLQQLEALDDDHKLGMLFYRSREENEQSKKIRLKLFHKDEPIHLSDVLPMLENFGLRIIGESPYQIKATDNHVYWVLDFQMLHSNVKLDLEAIRDVYQDAFAKVWQGHYEDDGFNRLVLSAGLTGRQVVILRMFAKYMRQIGTTFSQSYIESAFNKYPLVAKLIVKLFYSKFEPSIKSRTKKIAALETRINTELDNVANLDDDRIIRRYVELILAALRTNFFQPDQNGNEKPYISIKFLPEMVPEMPLPLPKYEIFVYSPRVEGVHLRGGKVARGGLRWSDRREDFRTEVLGLVKAQQVKNTVIVPVGAKGGFYCKKLPAEREAFFEEGKACYRTFIRALLDITDNIVNGEVVHPDQVVRHDEDDTYLVVAADKGTATFSDIANGISAEYNFWLGDAFASGGSVGYDHKKMAITARGAWESVKRHFREVGIDCQSTDFTAIGVGDMAGDVFGNGMLLSKHIRLVAAFNHMHIFIDPEPDAASSYKERERLFNLPRSSWEDYDKKLISSGGGVFARSAKAIELTPEMKKLFGTQKKSLTPTDMIKAILQMPVDLLWNGGIGTYVKSTKESDSDVGDRANDALRINGSELRAKIVGEGGNLGFTQLGRIEYARNGGRINTDAIDNVGGVDCSDNEVNIKILLNGVVAEGDLTRKQRDKLLFEMTDEVAQIVVKDCHRQSQSISVTAIRGPDQIKELQRFIHHLEREGQLNRSLEYLPDDDELAERQANGKGLTRPELAVLTAYGKMVLKEQLQDELVLNDPFHARSLINAFPKPLQERFADAMQTHPLRGQIIATRLANNIVNDMGPNFVYRKQDATGATGAEVAAAYVVARECFNLRGLMEQIEAQNNKVSAEIQNRMLFQVRRVVRRATRWFLRHKNPSLGTIQEHLDFYQASFNDLRKNVLKYVVADERAALEKEIEKLQLQGVPKDLAHQIGILSTLFSAMDIADIIHQTNCKVGLVAEAYFSLGARMSLHWFLEQINNQPVDNHWQALARAAFREELDWQQRSLTLSMLKGADLKKDASAILDAWLNHNNVYVERWLQTLNDFRTTKTHEFAKFSVTLRELMLLNHNCTTA